MSRLPEYRVAYTERPDGRGGFDAFVLPAGMVEESSSRRSEPAWTPVIAYGSHSYLREAFLAGCFDYLKEPWGPDELLLRLERLFRFSFKPHEWGRVRVHDTKISTASGEERELTLQEAAILKHLLSHRGQIVPREALFYVLWGKVPEGGSRAVDVHISSLRKKINGLLADNERENVIMTVRGSGYMIPAEPLES